MVQNTNSKSSIIVGRMSLDQVKTAFGRTRFFTHTRKDGSKYTVLRQVDKDGNALRNDDGSYCNVANVAKNFDAKQPALVLSCVYQKEQYNAQTGEVSTVWTPTRWLCNQGKDTAVGGSIFTEVD